MERSPAMESEVTQRHADQVREAFGYPERYLNARSHQVRLRRELTARMVGDGCASHILDVGCGDGSVSIPLLREGVRLTLVDVSSAMLDIARTHVPPQFRSSVEFVHGTIESFDTAERSYDLIVCVGVLAHVQHPLVIVSRLARFLTIGGLLILQHTDADHAIGRCLSAYSRLRGSICPGRHSWSRVTDRTLADACSDVDLDHIASFHYGLFPGLEQRFWPRHAYRLERAMFGDLVTNHRRWLGSDRITSWRRRPADED
jgi:2-polyprenyl-3-methyl-5-hydroxy-6-metoxy-1,4-benzoquinol methylase